MPNRGGDEGFGCGKETVPSFGVRIPDRLVYDNFAFEPDGKLATRKKTLVHLPRAAFDQLSDSVVINVVFTHPLGLPLTSLSRLENWGEPARGDLLNLRLVSSDNMLWAIVWKGSSANQVRPDDLDRA